MEDCIFCKIAKGEAPSYGVYEDKDNVAFLDIRQSAPGHTMVIPKKHGGNIYDFNEHELGSWISAVQKVAKKVQNGIRADWLTMGINHMEKLGVPHLHMHIVPRWEDDGGGIIQTIVNNPSKESKEEIAERIKKAN